MSSFCPLLYLCVYDICSICFFSPPHLSSFSLIWLFKVFVLVDYGMELLLSSTRNISCWAFLQVLLELSSSAFSVLITLFYLVKDIGLIFRWCYYSMVFYDNIFVRWMDLRYYIDYYWTWSLVFVHRFLCRSLGGKMLLFSFYVVHYLSRNL